MMPRSTRSTRSGRPLPSHANAGELDNQVVESGHNGPERRDRILAIAEAALLSLVTLAAAYSGYAAAQWNGESAVLLIEASEARTDAARADLDAREDRNFDLSTFEACFDAFVAEDQDAIAIA